MSHFERLTGTLRTPEKFTPADLAAFELKNQCVRLLMQEGTVQRDFAAAIWAPFDILKGRGPSFYTRVVNLGSISIESTGRDPRKSRAVTIYRPGERSRLALEGTKAKIQHTMPSFRSTWVISRKATEEDLQEYAQNLQPAV